MSTDIKIGASYVLSYQHLAVDVRNSDLEMIIERS